MDVLHFEWDDRKNAATQAKHLSDGTIRIIGAGYWRKGKAVYEKENRLQQ